MSTDRTVEDYFKLIGSSNTNFILYADRGRNFDGTAIKIYLRTRDITPQKGRNVRFTAFRPEIEPEANRNMFFRYLLDGRLSEYTGSGSNFLELLEGENKTLGLIKIKNQAQYIDRIRPKINYAKGTSIAFEIYDDTKNMTFNMIGIGLDFIPRAMKKSKKIGA